MTPRWLGRQGAVGASARRAMMALWLGAAIVSLGDLVTAQGSQGQGSATLVDPFAAAAAERTRDLPPGPPAAAPTKPWWGTFLPDGQPALPEGVWRAASGATQYLDRDQPGFNKGGRVVDPPGGKIPYQPWALELKKTADYDLLSPTKPWHVDTQARCLSSPPRVMYAVFTYAILQPPGFVVFQWENYHYSRVIPLDGSPHIGSDIKLLFGDARGHWEGNTLVVDTTNLSAKDKLTSSGDFMSPNAHLTERMTFVDADTMTYEATIEDPTVFTRPWTIRVAHKREPNEELYEWMCPEGLDHRAELPGTLP